MVSIGQGLHPFDAASRSLCPSLKEGRKKRAIRDCADFQSPFEKRAIRDCADFQSPFEGGLQRSVSDDAGG